MVCPRCGRESTEGAAVCRRCGAPLLIPEDPPPRPLDVSLDLDRRARTTLPGLPTPPAPKRPPLPPAEAGAPTVPPAGAERPAGQPSWPPESAPPPGPSAPVRPPVDRVGAIGAQVHERAARPPAPPVKIPIAPARAAPPAPAPPPPPSERRPAVPPPEFLAPPFTPLPQTEVSGRAHLEDPPDFDRYAFADLPEDDPPELAEPPMTSEADDAFAELTERVRAGTPLPAAPPAPAVSPPTPAAAVAPTVARPPPEPPPARVEPSVRPAPPAPPPVAAPPARPVTAAALRPAPPPLPVPPPAPPPSRAQPVTPPRNRAAAHVAAGGELPEAEVTSLEIHVRRPPSWRRAAAWLVDGVPFAAAIAALVAWLGGQVPGRPPGGPAALDLLLADRTVALSLAAVLALALFAYGTLAHALGGATLGKVVLRIRVVGPDGARPSLTRSAFRSAAAVVSAGMLGLGFLLALFTRTGRSLHDLVARTWVVEAP